VLDRKARRDEGAGLVGGDGDLVVGVVEVQPDVAAPDSVSSTKIVSRITLLQPARRSGRSSPSPGDAPGEPFRITALSRRSMPMVLSTDWPSGSSDVSLFGGGGGVKAAPPFIPAEPKAGSRGAKALWTSR